MGQADGLHQVLDRAIISLGLASNHENVPSFALFACAISGHEQDLYSVKVPQRDACVQIFRRRDTLISR